MSDGPLDWTLCIPQFKPCLVDEPQLEIPPEGEDYDASITKTAVRTATEEWTLTYGIVKASQTRT